ncbi:hypothetical protein O7621_19630 [Solwaraspora sp. WMMD937]|uniref:hypothetical protein n=1 Tax=Solwaraspora sp. WMMD937 TaxID=3016090 RepID=UPI00249A9A8B|nr:hypothetical protein [Solwaraspora sp. WMMD937]WFE20105.1 hypothetical protein O7621_19630 [Solwaraspora sp. WMMD937]
MPHVIRHNGARPGELSGWPKIEPSFQAVGVDEESFLASLPQQAVNAYEDQCAPANPRMPVLDDMQEIMRTAYYGAAGR